MIKCEDHDKNKELSGNPYYVAVQLQLCCLGITRPNLIWCLLFFSLVSPQAKYISTCIDEIKQELKQDNIAVKANAVCKLTYVRSLHRCFFVFMYNELHSTQQRCPLFLFHDGFLFPAVGKKNHSE